MRKWPIIASMLNARFGRLVVVAKALRPRYWVVQCDCGRIRECLSSNLTRGLTTSCNCLRTDLHRARLLRHGHARQRKHSRTYQSWHHAKRRCFSLSDAKYHDYGGRGITMSDEWKNNFASFLRDMGPAPDGCSIDRINNDGNYERGNCRWATPKTQANNRRPRRR